MKKTLLMFSIIFTAVLLFSCGHQGATKTSLVTIAIGNNQIASIKAAPATFTNKAVAFFAKLFSGTGSTADAAIPSVVSDIRVTVSAPDMPTISQAQNVAGQSMVVITLEVPNGLNRDFLIEGLDNTSAVTYWNEFLENLSGSELNKSVEMLFIGAARTYLYVDIVNGDDILNPGTKASPYRTITKALATARLIKGNVAIFINPNPPAMPYSVKNGETTFPLALSGNTALVCMGSNFTTVIDNTSTFGGGTATTISGAAGSVVNGCRINGAPVAATIDDAASPMTIISSYVFGDTLSPGNSPQVCVSLAANSRVAKTTITGCSFNTSGIGINITAGSPILELNTITTNQGTGVVVSGGTPVIQNNQINANTGAPGTGIVVSGGIPTIQGNEIQTNTTGISVTSATTATIVTGNNIHGNTTGISVSGSTASPSINSNRIYCNTGSDLNAAGTTALNATSNSWDHDSTTTPPGPTVGIAGCPAGTDICGGGTVTYTPFNSAVSGGCL